MIFKRSVALAGLFLLSGCRFGIMKNSEYRHLERAEEFIRQSNYDQAIEEYRSHMNYRLHIKDRPEWENPSFYLLMIGDLYLKKNDEAAALAAYEEAEKKGVEAGLVGDRYRYVASWHEKNGRLREALTVLNKYRDKDELLFDVMADRIAKELVRQEEEAPPQPTPTAAP